MNTMSQSHNIQNQIEFDGLVIGFLGVQIEEEEEKKPGEKILVSKLDSYRDHQSGNEEIDEPCPVRCCRRYTWSNTFSGLLSRLSSCCDELDALLISIRGVVMLTSNVICLEANLAAPPEFLLSAWLSCIPGR